MPAAVILAAGASSRMGHPKQLIAHAGESLIRRVIRVARAAGLSPIIVVTGAHREAIDHEIASEQVVEAFNPIWERGIGTSIRIGVATAAVSDESLDGVAILLCDQPAITTASLRQFVAAFQARPQHPCVSRFPAGLGPPVILPRFYFDKVQMLPDDQGAKGLWSLDSQTQFVDCAEAGIDLDTPEDLKRWMGAS